MMRHPVRESQIPTYQKDYVVMLLVLVPLLAICHAQEWKPEIPPWGPYFENSVVVRTYYGDVKGFSVPWHIEDTYDVERTEGGPLWYQRRVNNFLGIPYALPPLGDYRFREPRRPRWGLTWDSTYFRPACPQRIDNILEDIPTFPHQNVSEDCLYMNIFAPNRTYDPPETLFPVMVFIHGGEFMYGTAQQYPGHVMATKEVVVVTFNYRLGALGFLTTEDEYGAGNWGLHDQQMALEFVKLNIRQFRGDPDNITLFGEGSGAASVGLHMLSPKSRGKEFYHQAIMMSGVDTSPFGSIDPYWRPRDYARNFSQWMGCKSEDSYVMLECLRDDKQHTWQRILDVQDFMKPRNGELGQVWGPVQDGGYYNVWPFLPMTPLDLRTQFNFEHVPTLIGLNTNDGCMVANQTSPGLKRGMYKGEFRQKIDEFLRDLRVLPHYHSRVADAVEFQYTWWPDPSNNSARTQEYINMMTDMRYGTWIDQTVKQTAENLPTYMYVFNHRSWEDWRDKWMGISYSASLPYVFGFPFFNETVLNETEIVPRQWYDYLDRNISDFMLTMWTNFAKYGNPTPNITRNVTWQPFNTYNLSYLIVEEYSHLSWRYRQPKYGFWKEYFPLIAMRDYLIPTPTPTPADFPYVLATGTLSGLLFFLFVIMAVCIYFLYYQTKLEEEKEYGPDTGLAYANPQAVSTGSKTPGTSTIHSDFTSGRTSPYFIDPHGSNSSGLQGAGALGFDMKSQPYVYKDGRPQKASTYETQAQIVEPAPKVHYSYKGGRPDYSQRPDYLPRQGFRPDYSQAYETASSMMDTERSQPSSHRYDQSDPSFQSTQPSFQSPSDPELEHDDNSQSELIAPIPPRRAPYSYQGGRPTTGTTTSDERARTPSYMMELSDFTRRTPRYISETDA